MPIHLLLLEPNTERRQSLAAAMRAAGVQVVETATGPSAAESIESGGFDGILVSLRLPQLDQAALRRALCPSAPGLPVSLDAAERLHIARTLEHTGGNRRQAALILGISRSTLLHKIRKYGLDDEQRARRSVSGREGG